MSYPEVVSEMRGFLSEVAIGFRPIVVGIDELDKMESGEHARKFLNDIKGVFGVNNCYFLVSVSIDAMSSFERRGMPFRDAFDSSFDEILTVSALTYKDASAIINRRVIGVSNQFIALAYVISGGIARDLIRAMRKLVTLANNDDNDEHKESHNNKTLQSLSARLVAGEVTAKLAAVGIALQNDIGSEWKDQILCVARKLNPDDENSLLEAARKLRAAAHPTHESDGSSAELASDLAVYLYFAATVIRYFNDSLDEQQLKMAEDSGLLEGLARCRQKFVMGAAEAWREIDDCRTACHLDTLPFLTTQAALRPA
jgi:hypothetical protein